MFNVNFILDIVLIAAAVWMVITVRGLGGIIGKGLNLITIGALILGIAHFLSTAMRSFGMDAATDSLFHRGVVLVGFIVLIVGFKQIEAIKR